MDFYGTPTELSNSDIDFSEFLQMKHEDSDIRDEEENVQADTKKLNVDATDEVAKLEDTSKNKARDSLMKTYFRSGSNFCALTGLFTLFVLSQILASGCDFWVAFWYVNFQIILVCMKSSDSNRR